MRICSCWFTGNWSTIRVTCPRALVVCSVPKHKVTRLGGSQGGFDGFQVAQFAHEDDVRVHTQRTAQGMPSEAPHVHADLALVDHRLLVRVVVFDRVFDGDDVGVEMLVDVS